MRTRTLFGVLPVLGISFVAEAAHASDPYPRVIVQVYTVSSMPECTLCHATLKGGNDTVTTAFGKNLYARGARGKNPLSLDAALREAANARQDSDGDGVTDLTELRIGTDPNFEGDAEPVQGEGGAGGEVELGSLDHLPPLPAHGCTLALASHASALVSLVGVAVLAALRRRRRHSEPPV